MTQVERLCEESRSAGLGAIAPGGNGQSEYDILPDICRTVYVRYGVNGLQTVSVTGTPAGGGGEWITSGEAQRRGGLEGSSEDGSESGELAGRSMTVRGGESSGEQRRVYEKRRTVEVFLQEHGLFLARWSALVVDRWRVVVALLAKISSSAPMRVSGKT